MHDQPISSLRQRTLDAMAVRNFSDKTRHDYIRHIKSFASFLGRSPDTASADDLRRFQLFAAFSLKYDLLIAELIFAALS